MHIAFNTTQAVPDFDSTATNREQGRWGPVKDHHASSFFPLISPALGPMLELITPDRVVRGQR